MRLKRNLISDIEKLETGQTVPHLNILEQKKQELMDYRQIEMQGHVVRLRMQWIAEGDKPSRYFCALEHSHYTDKTIKCL